MSTRGERWDRDRFDYEARYDDDKYTMRGGRGRDRDYPDDDDRYDRRAPRAYDDDIVRERRYYDGPPPRREMAPEYQRRAPPVMEREREREYYHRESSPPRRPGFLRRQSSLDTYDRRPMRQFYEQREEYPVPARREDIYREEIRERDDYRAPPYTDIPLPKSKTKAILPPRHYEDRYYEDIKVAEPDYYGDEDYRPYPDRVREREVIRERRDDRTVSPARTARTGRSGRSSHARTRRGSSPTSTTTSRSSSSDGGTTVKSAPKDEYPKKGKTRVPMRLVSKRAIIDLGYPFTEEGTTIIIQKALGQDNIDELLKLSEEYKKSEAEVAAARSSAGNVMEERRTEEVFVPAPVPAPEPAPAPQPPPSVHHHHHPPPPPPAPAPVIIEAGPARNYSPSRATSSSSSHSSYHHHHHHETSGAIPVGPLALAERSRSRSRSRGGREIRAEIRALERELVHRPKRAEISERELVRAERLPNGELVLYEEQIEVEHTPKPARIEKDKKGRLSLSVPRRP